MSNQNESLRQTLEQERAKKAWEFVNSINSEQDEKTKKEYRSIALKMPILILTNGLGQTLAFVKSKEDNQNAHSLFYGHLQGWLNSRINWDNTKELVDNIVNTNTEQYRYATSESLAFLVWLKRFADAILPKEEGG